ncbi:Copper transporter [Rhodotorula toruloides ATCC 204091]|uniref:Copper transport protein n=1 Tax=Rhodotorula toruloides TaxID=5286 RepID=A0A0K3CG18_RHOTO|nr:Copper transporter [Rhodotorula toruloides ATCC 204091]KAK4336239.1 Copper transporter [Rhodotorula toruloides]PRQ74471.1 Ctr copper transporter family-domain containing protein [Rhodotorula toruloides]
MATRLAPRHGGMEMDGMDMGMSNSTSATMMSTFFTTSLGSANVWFSGWTPTTAGETFGACLGLFFLAVLSRFLSAVKACAEVAWLHSYQQQGRARRRNGPIALPDSTPSPPDTLDPSAAASNLQKETSRSSPAPSYPSSSTSSREPLFSPPFSLAIDLPRSLLFGLQAFIAYLLMLAVMTYNAYFFIAILLGLVAGEMAFGRYIALLLGAGAHAGHGENGLHG